MLSPEEVLCATCRNSWIESERRPDFIFQSPPLLQDVASTTPPASNNPILTLSKAQSANFALYTQTSHQDTSHCKPPLTQIRLRVATLSTSPTLLTPPRKTLTIELHLTPDLYMYSCPDYGFRIDPPPKLHSLRISRRPDSNHHCSNG